MPLGQKAPWQKEIASYIGIMEKQMETTTVYWGYFGIMEKKMETTIVYWGYVVEVGMIRWLGNVNFNQE